MTGRAWHSATASPSEFHESAEGVGTPSKWILRRPNSEEIAKAFCLSAIGQLYNIIKIILNNFCFLKKFREATVSVDK
eukprot:scaffold1954_cov268-Pinguiococcus_pyrenoidosus.AAC.190